MIIISEHCCAASYCHGNGDTFDQDRLMNRKFCRTAFIWNL